MSTAAEVRSFLFTDIEESTPKWHHHPDAMADASRRHDEIVREVVDGHGGRIFAHTGDGVGAVFAVPRRALAAAEQLHQALAAETWPETTPIRVRIGVHAGPAEERDDNYFGSTVSATARVMDAGHGGQTVVTETALRADPAVSPEDSAATPLGSFVLRGFDGSIPLYQWGAGSFGPLRSVGQRESRLPAIRNTLVGRAELVRRARGLLLDHPVVTLLGTGGSGKTRLAVEVAHAELAERAGGACFVDLTSVDDPAAVPATIASALEINQWDRDATEAVAAWIAEPARLLVLDNCEHVVDAVADLVEEILPSIGDGRILTTSREPLDVEGEQLLPVAPLPAGGADSAAVTLFVERARQVLPDFDPRDHIDAVVSLCQRLDGLPLAIELAAARVSTMTVAELVELLDDRFELLGGGRRRRNRTRTLEATVAWSYDLLDDAEQRAFRRLGVFVGRFDVDLAARLLGCDTARARRLLDDLCARSLVIAEPEVTLTRYRLLETLRAYAGERLAERGEVGELRAAHVAAVLDRARAATHLVIPNEQNLAELERLADEIESARAWADRHGDRVDADWLAVAVVQSRIWTMGGQLIDLDAAVERHGPETELGGRLRASCAARCISDNRLGQAILRGAEMMDCAEDQVRVAGAIYVAFFDFNPDRPAAHVPHRVIDALPESHPDRERHLALLAEADWLTGITAGDLAGAHDRLVRATEAIPPPHNLFAPVTAAFLLASSIVNGDVADGIRRAEAFTFDAPAFFDVESIWSAALASVGRLDEARDFLDRSLALARRVDPSPVADSAQVGVAAVALAEGDEDAARAALDRIEAVRTPAHVLLDSHLRCRLDPGLDLHSTLLDRFLALFGRFYDAESLALARAIGERHPAPTNPADGAAS